VRVTITEKEIRGKKLSDEILVMLAQDVPIELLDSMNREMKKRSAKNKGLI